MSKVNGDHRSPYQVFPDLPPEEFETLKRDIAERGVQVAVEITPEGDILDGHQRVRSRSKLTFQKSIVLLLCSAHLERIAVSDRPSRLFSAQQETVQRSPGWDWIFTYMVAEMRASGCSILSI